MVIKHFLYHYRNQNDLSDTQQQTFDAVCQICTTVKGESIRWGKLSLDSLVVASAKVLVENVIFLNLKNRSCIKSFVTLKHAVGLRIFVPCHYTELFKWTTQGGTIASPNPFCAFVPEDVAKLNYLIPNFINFLQIARSLLKGYSVKHETIDWY